MAAGQEGGVSDELDGDEGVVAWTCIAPLDGFLVRLAAGWCLPLIVEPMRGPHGFYSILLTRADEP